MVSEDARSPDPALRGFPSTREGDEGQIPVRKVTTGAGDQLWFWSQNTWLPAPAPPPTFAGGRTLRPQTSVWEKENLTFYNLMQCLFLGLIQMDDRELLFFPLCPGFVPQSQPLTQGRRGTWTPSALSSPVPAEMPIFSAPALPVGPGISHLCVRGFAGLPSAQGSASCTCHTVRKLFAKQTNSIRDTCSFIMVL